MKKGNIKRILLLAVILALAGNSFAKENPLTFSLSPAVGISFGEWGEYIFDPDDDFLLSYLDWKSKPIFKTELGFGISFRNFSFDLSTACGFPAKKNGTMFDSDFNGAGERIIFSENDLYSGFSFEAALEAKYNFQKNVFTFSPALSVEYSNYFFTAKDGHGWYGEKYYSYISGYSTYKIHNFYSFAGFCFGVQPFERFSISLGGYVSPYAYTYTHDIHYRKTGISSKYVLAEQNYFFKRFKVGFSGNYKITSLIQLNIGADCIFGPKVYGRYLFYANDFKTKEDFYLNQKGKSASDIFVLDIMAGVSFRF